MRGLFPLRAVAASAIAFAALIGVGELTFGASESEGPRPVIEDCVRRELPARGPERLGPACPPTVPRVVAVKGQ